MPMILRLFCRYISFVALLLSLHTANVEASQRVLRGRLAHLPDVKSPRQLVRLLAKGSREAKQPASRKQLGGLPFRGGTANLNGVCLAHNCGRFDKLLGGAGGSCAAAYKCKACRAPEYGLEQCARVISAPAGTSTLAVGGVVTEQQLKKAWLNKNKRESTRLELQWEKGPDAPLELLQCGVEDAGDRKMMLIASGKHHDFHHKLVLAVAVWNTSPKADVPRLTIDVIYHPTQEDLNERGAFVRAGKCRSTHGASFKLPSSELRQGDMVEVIRSFSVPMDKEDPVVPGDFEIQLRCDNRLNQCDLSAFRFCARILCETAISSQAEAVAHALALTNALPQPQEEEEEQEQPEEGDELTAEQLADRILNEKMAAAGVGVGEEEVEPLPELPQGSVARLKSYRGDSRIGGSRPLVLAAVAVGVVFTFAGVIWLLVRWNSNSTTHHQSSKKPKKIKRALP